VPQLFLISPVNLLAQIVDLAIDVGLGLIAFDNADDVLRFCLQR
jgi:hypothetical protein